MTDSPTEESPQRSYTGGIDTIYVKNFKSLAGEHSIGIRPLTILAGANSSGKSSAMQPLLLLKQTLDATYDPGPILLKGPNVRFTSADQFISRVAEEASRNTVMVGIALYDENLFLAVFSKNQARNSRSTKASLDISSVHYKNRDDYEITLYSGMTEAQIEEAIPAHLKWLWARQEPGRWRLIRDKFFLNVELYVRNGEGPGLPNSPPLISETYLIAYLIQGIIHVPGLRGNPERVYEATTVGPTFPGTFEAYVASLINYWQATNDSRLKELGSALADLGLTSKIETSRINDVQIEIKVGQRLYAAADDEEAMVSIADVGLGVSQVLPVLVALLVAVPGQMVYIEQPEIHLHPRAQAALASILVAAANRGVRVVVETHSALLLTAIQTCVARGAIEPNNVILHWFQKGADEVTQIHSTELDEAGTFGDWPEDFADVMLKVEGNYIDAIQERLMEE